MTIKKTDIFQQIFASSTTMSIHTDYHFEGEFFKSRTKNQYFCVMDKNVKVGELSSLSNFHGDFRPLDHFESLRTCDPEKQVLLRLEFTKNKFYFVESNQAISIRNPDVTVMNMSLGDLHMITPKFEPLPQG